MVAYRAFVQRAAADTDGTVRLELKRAIQESDPNLLGRAINSLEHQLEETASMTQIALNTQELIAVQADANAPEPQILDRLMRYETTLHRQLSSALGELLETSTLASTERFSVA